MEQGHRLEGIGADIPFQKLWEWQTQSPVPVQEKLGGQGHCTVPDENDPCP